MLLALCRPELHAKRRRLLLVGALVVIEWLQRFPSRLLQGLPGLGPAAVERSRQLHEVTLVLDPACPLVDVLVGHHGQVLVLSSSSRLALSLRCLGAGELRRGRSRRRVLRSRAPRCFALHCPLVGFEPLGGAVGSSVRLIPGAVLLPASTGHVVVGRFVVGEQLRGGLLGLDADRDAVVDVLRVDRELVLWPRGGVEHARLLDLFDRRVLGVGVRVLRAWKLMRQVPTGLVVALLVRRRRLPLRSPEESSRRVRHADQEGSRRGGIVAGWLRGSVGSPDSLIVAVRLLVEEFEGGLGRDVASGDVLVAVLAHQILQFVGRLLGALVARDILLPLLLVLDYVLNLRPLVVLVQEEGLSLLVSLRYDALAERLLFQGCLDLQRRLARNRGPFLRTLSWGPTRASRVRACNIAVVRVCPEYRGLVPVLCRIELWNLRGWPQDGMPGRSPLASES